MARLAYRYTDRQILVGWILVQVVSSAALYDFGLPAVYLLGSFVYFNAVTLQVAFSVALSSKVCRPHHVESIQSWVVIVASIMRGIGAIVGAMLDIDESAYLCMAGAVFSFAGTLALCPRLHYQV